MRYLVDLLSRGPDVISRIDPELIRAGQQTGRVLLAPDDPRLGMLLLLGFEATRVEPVDPVASQPHPRG